MTARKIAMLEAGLDRRAFMAGMGGLGVLGYAVPGVFAVRQAAASRPAPPRPVVSVYMDLPYVDMTGRARPYVPPAASKAPAKRTLAEDFGNGQYYQV